MVDIGSYYGMFPDGTPDRWNFRREDSGWEITLPNFACLTLPFEASHLDFRARISTDASTTRLWINSLRYLIPILENHDYDLVSSVLTDFSRHLKGLECEEKNPFPGNLDHQFALELRTLCEIEAFLQSHDEASIPDWTSSFLEKVVADIFFLVEKFNLLVRNNHGVMLAIAMMHALVVFPGTSSEEGFSLSKIRNFLTDTFKEVLGKEGMANENTPFYQSFYISLLEEIAAFETWAFGESSTNTEGYLLSAINAYRKVLLPNNALPPLGDNSYSSQSRFTAELGLWFSKENGFAKYSQDDFYFSMVCGYRGIIHKQMDDSSIFLWHNGTCLIQDAGLVSYDTNDPVAMGVRGQLGHSGLFFQSFDDIRAEKVVAFGPRTRLVKAGLNVSAAADLKTFQITGNVAFRETRVERSIEWIGQKRFVLTDTVKVGQENQGPVSRFLLDPKAKVSILDQGAVRVTQENSWMEISPTSPLGGGLQIHRGVRTIAGLAKGFLAPRNYNSVPTNLIEFPIHLEDGQGQQSFEITFGGVDSN